MPLPGGLNGTLSNGAGSPQADGNAQSWSGYVGQISSTGANSRIMTRQPQTSTANNNQELVTSGSGGSYSSPAAATVDFQNIAGVTLTAGAQYTEVLKITLNSFYTLTITNTLYQGGDTSGPVVTQFGGQASGATYLTNSFDGFAIGWRAMASTTASAIDINQIKVNYNITEIPPLLPPVITPQVIGNQLQLSWPVGNIGWTLQIQTNDLTAGIGTNWYPIANSTTTNLVTIPITSSNSAVFLRMIYR